MGAKLVRGSYVSWALAGCVCSFFTLGCHKAQVLRIYNNTGRDGVIELGPQGGMWLVKRSFPHGREVELGDVFIRWPVYVYFDQETWLYEDVGGLGWSPVWWARNDPAKYQIEPNGALFYIPTELEMPARELPKQPEGYPKFPFRKKTGRN